MPQFRNVPRTSSREIGLVTLGVADLPRTLKVAPIVPSLGDGSRPEVTVHLRIRVARGREDDLRRFLREAIPFYESPGGIRVRLLGDTSSRIVSLRSLTTPANRPIGPTKSACKPMRPWPSISLGGGPYSLNRRLSRLIDTSTRRESRVRALPPTRFVAGLGEMRLACPRCRSVS
jgi:hypothetical protein